MYLKYSFILYLAVQFFALNLNAQEISQAHLLGNEPSICFSKIKNNRLYLGTNNSHFYKSDDLGKNWISIATKSQYGFYGDPVLAATENGKIFLAHLSKTEGKKWGDWFDRIVVQEYDEKADSFSNEWAIGFNNNKIQDKPWLTYDKNTNTLHLSWTEFDKYGDSSENCASRIQYAFYELDKKTWSKVTTISNSEGNCLDDDGTLEGATVAVSENNKTAVWAGKGKLFSNDLNNKNAKEEIITEQIDGWNLQLKNIYRTNGLPFSLYLKDTLVVVYAQIRQGQMPEVIVLKKHNNIINKIVYKNAFLPNIQKYKNEIMMIAYQILDSTFSYMTPYLYNLQTGKEVALRAPFPFPGKTFFGDYNSLDMKQDKIAVAYTINDQGTILVETKVLKTDIWDKELNFSYNPLQLVKIDKDYYFLVLPFMDQGQEFVKIKSFNHKQLRYFKRYKSYQTNKKQVYIYSPKQRYFKVKTPSGRKLVIIKVE